MFKLMDKKIIKIFYANDFFLSGPMLVCLLVYFFRSKGHHYVNRTDYVVYTRMWAKFSTEMVPLTSTWAERVTFGLHASTSSSAINRQMAGDSNCPLITGCCVMTDGEVVLCDTRNSSLK